MRLQPKVGVFNLYLGKNNVLPTKDNCLISSDNNEIFFSNDTKYENTFD